jgi:TM2 domain-containing membrane protein YozV
MSWDEAHLLALPGAILIGLLGVAAITLVRVVRGRPTKQWQKACSGLAALFIIVVAIGVLGDLAVLPQALSERVLKAGSLVLLVGLVVGVPVAIAADVRRSKPIVGHPFSDQKEASMKQQMPMLSEKFCFQCGEKIHGLAEICPKCGLRQLMLPGMPIAGPLPGIKTPNRLTAALFGLLLGGLGVHKFYLGQVGWGIAYLLLCWTFVPFVVGFIEGLVFLTMSESAFAAKYAR